MVSVRRLQVTMRERNPRVLLSPTVVALCALSVVLASPSKPFLKAAREADNVVMVKIDESITGRESVAGLIVLRVTETLRGTRTGGTIWVAPCIWSAITHDRVTPGSTAYLLLLRGDEEILCGHINGLAPLSGGCMGLLPSVDDAIPKEWAWAYSSETTTQIPMARVRQDVRDLKSDK